MTKPTGDPLEYAMEIIMRLIPGWIGKLIAFVLFLIAAAIGLLEMYYTVSQWFR